jgi:hypothetical protein
MKYQCEHCSFHWIGTSHTFDDVRNRGALLGIKRFVENKEKDVKSIKIFQKDLEFSIDEIKKVRQT